MKINIADIFKTENSVYSLPAVQVRLHAMLKDPKSSNWEIANVIEKDSGLSLVVLKLVNSAIYGFRHKISTITQAVSLLGRNELSVLLLSTGVVKLFQKLPVKKEQLNTHWQHSLFCGLIAKNLAAYDSQTFDSSTAFMAGLLHDIGKPIIWHKLPEESRQIYIETETKQTLDREINILEFSHSDVGYQLMKLWNLPKNLQAATRWHHAPESANEYIEFCRLIYFANILANLDDKAFEDESFPLPINLTNINISKEMARKATEEAKLVLSDMSRLYLN